MDGEKTSINFSLYPLFRLAVCFAFGVLAAGYFETGWRISLFTCLFCAALAQSFIKQKFAVVFASLAFIAAGAFCLQIKNQTIPANRLKRIYDEKRINSGEPVEIEGVLRGKYEEATGGFFAEISVEKLVYKSETQNVSGRIRLFAFIPDEQIAREYEQLNLRYGSRIRVACNPVREDEFQNPGVASRREILDRQDLDATCSIKSPLLIEKNGDENSFISPARLYEMRKNLIAEFREKFSVSTAGIMIASLLGSKYFLDKRSAELFREGGTFHVLVISGLHITFIGGLTLLLVQFFTRRRFWQFLIASSLLWAFSIAVGADVPVVRATIMFTVLLFSQVIYRHGNLLNSLGLCALILLVWRPEDLFSQSFQLTFMSVLAIVVFAFPLIENLRAIGEWRPTAAAPFPPNVPEWLKRFCEMLYWNEKSWQIEARRQIWSARIFKSPYLKILEARGWQGVFRYLFEGVLVSMVVQIWLLPLTAFYFHRVSVVSVLLNLWVGIFIALESFAAIIALFFAQFSAVLALPLVKLTEFLNWILLALPAVFAENNWASFRVPVYSGNLKAIYFLYFAPILILTILLYRWRPFDLNSNFKFQMSDSENSGLFNRGLVFAPKFILRVSAALLAIFVLIIIYHPFSAPRADGRLHVDFLDVGQGDSALVTFPNGETLLVDGGGKPGFKNLYVRRDAEEPEIFEPDTATIGESVVSQFLWEKGYSKIDYILATHADADHIQGLTDIARNFSVRAAFFGRTPETDEDFSRLFKVLQTRKIDIIKLKRGDVLSFEEARVEVLYPEADDSPEAVSDNNHSLVLRIVFDRKKFLLTGDIERETENFLMQNPQLLMADVVKVAHHGSRTSSIQGFVTATKAAYAIISVGKTSQFGHPHKEVVERWQASGAKVLTTGERGTISVSTNGNDLLIERFLP
ncbi:MAG TPA: ComEC/Rec2 family competence protein [Pyrinomonadaceae bacterium]|jgi:competence protein ComEC